MLKITDVYLLGAFYLHKFEEVRTSNSDERSGTSHAPSVQQFRDSSESLLGRPMTSRINDLILFRKFSFVEELGSEQDSVQKMMHAAQDGLLLFPEEGPPQEPPRAMRGRDTFDWKTDHGMFL